MTYRAISDWYIWENLGLKLLDLQPVLNFWVRFCLNLKVFLNELLDLVNLPLSRVWCPLQMVTTWNLRAHFLFVKYLLDLGGSVCLRINGVHLGRVTGGFLSSYHFPIGLHHIRILLLDLVWSYCCYYWKLILVLSLSLVNVSSLLFTVLLSLYYWSAVASLCQRKISIII